MATNDGSASLDINAYSFDDLLVLLNLSEDATVFQVKDAANQWIAQMISNKKPALAAFFSKARDRLLKEMRTLADPRVAQQNENESIEAVWGPNQITPRDDPATFLFDDGTHFAAKEKTQGVTGDGGGPPIIMTRIVSIDSQFRATILPYSSSPLAASFNTQFSFNLANPVNNAVGFRLYAYQIPTTWYTFNTSQGNNFFQYNGVIITVPDGNYTVTQLRDTLNALAQLDIATAGLVVSGPNPNTGRLTFTNTDPYSADVTVIFYIQQNTTNVYACSQELAALFQTVGINNTLGWLLGFRTTPNAISGDVILTLPLNVPTLADVPADVYGPKYLILSVEDFNNQRLTSGLTSITTTKNYASMSVPDYFKTINVACRLQTGNLTQAQLFSINAITTDNNVAAASNYNTSSVANQLPGPNNGSAFAYIPLPNLLNLRPNPLIAYGEDLAIFERKYIQPCRLERLAVSLTDDKGNLVNLGDNTWSFALLVDAQIS